MNSSSRTTLKGSPLVLAPGKLFLAGEYAVLEGGVAAAGGRRTLRRGPVPARVRARERPGGRGGGPRAAETLGEVADAVPEGAALVDTAGFTENGVKLGLGSSAAAAVAAAGAVLEYAGVSVATNKELLFSVADAAHRAAQGGVGSGADIAAAVYGGFVRYVRLSGGAPIITRVLPPPRLHLVPFWTLGAARTVDFIAGRAGASRKREHPRRSTDTCRRCAPRPTASPRRSPPATRAGVIARGRRLRTGAGGPGARRRAAHRHPDPARRRRCWPASLGGAAKPSGAGGGDVGVAFFADEAAARRVPGAVLGRGFGARHRPRCNRGLPALAQWHRNVQKGLKSPDVQGRTPGSPASTACRSARGAMSCWPGWR